MLYCDKWTSVDKVRKCHCAPCLGRLEGSLFVIQEWLESGAKIVREL